MKTIYNAAKKAATVKLFLVLFALTCCLQLIGQNRIVPTEAAAELSPPIGTIMAFAGPVDTTFETQTGWLLCDGRPLNRTDARYRALFRAVGTTWGGDADTMFNIPDLRGRFVRGVDKNIQGVATPAGEAGPRDPDRDGRGPASPLSVSQGNRGNFVGSLQEDALESHGHDVSDPGHSHSFDAFRTDGAGGVGQAYPRDPNGFGTGRTVTNITIPRSGGGSETRPVNAYVNWIIRFK